MSQQYGQPPGQGPQGQPPQYGQPPPQPGYQPQQPPAYNTPPPGYVQPQQPPAPAYQPPQQAHNYQPPPPVARPMAAPAPQVQADGYERTLSLLVYIWVALFGTTGTFIALRGVDIGNRLDISFRLDLAELIGLLLPFIVMIAVRNGELVRFHARQALYLALAYIVLRLVVELFYLIPTRGVQDILVSGVLVGLVRLLIVFAALYAGVRAFANRELYRLPIIGNLVH